MMHMGHIHGLSDVQTSSIGEGTRIWQYCVVLPGAKIGSGCNICAHVLIENDVVIGDDVTVKSGVQLWDGVRVGNGVFIGPNVTFTNDKFPRSKNYPEEFVETFIDEGASIGANATILPGIKIGRNAMVGAGVVVTRDVPPNSIVTGNPAAIVGYVDTQKYSEESIQADRVSDEGRCKDLSVGGCKLYNLPLIPDLRGSLSVTEFEKDLPFVPRRCFWVFDVPSRGVRGEHAHKELYEYLICVKGSVSVLLDDSFVRKEVCLDQPNLGLYIPPRVWRVMYKYSSDAILLVLASHEYSSDDYIREYGKFLDYVKQEKA